MGKIKIKGMSCQHCVQSVKEALEKISGVSDVHVDLSEGEATYSGEIESDLLRRTIEEIGFELG